MKVRSITLFVPAERPPSVDDLQPVCRLAAEARARLEGVGFVVQSSRLALPPWRRWYGSLPSADLLVAAQRIEGAAVALGIDYVSLGPVSLAARDSPLDAMKLVPDLLAGTERVFASVLIASVAEGLNLSAAREAAEVVLRNMMIEPAGFGNLRFAVLAGVGPGSPFFPAAYADPAWSRPALALALESADLAVAAFREAGTLEAATDALRTRLEATAAALVEAVAPLVEREGADFLGLDFSLAPFPTPDVSAAGALELLGARPFGASGTLLAAALTTEALQTAAYPHCGFSGLMLPVLEDSVLAGRAAMGTYDLHSLLLFSAVCGIGLDTIPLPGDTSPEALTAVLLDVAALALRLDKPLTARLMPIPNKKAGEITSFDFPYFADSAILAVRPPRGGALLAGGHVRMLPLSRR